MLPVYGVEHGIEHYGCMVDLLGRAGFLEEALELVRAMPMAPNVVVLGSLLHACQVHKDTKLSEQVSKQLLELDPHDGGNYVFLSNFYASVNRWHDVEICRKLMVEKGVQKTPGCCSIEVDNVVHEFFADVEEKQSAVKYHCERLAVAFGLMSTHTGNPIRLVKTSEHVVIAMLL
ncbi:hypothetical protein IFM89_000701 [Coptis chinensis]|uniref:Pentatricopeptide repeat-containing protein n=1 Tax=Coptis chinensis TaxID=261450 RepID=A0A835HBS2_9MAGN|nr:hypothetical protein IFM89_000701 [Coptis chinensis]